VIDWVIDRQKYYSLRCSWQSHYQFTDNNQQTNQKY